MPAKGFPNPASLAYITSGPSSGEHQEHISQGGWRRSSRRQSRLGVVVTGRRGDAVLHIGVTRSRQMGVAGAGQMENALIIVVVVVIVVAIVVADSVVALAVLLVVAAAVVVVMVVVAVVVVAKIVGHLELSLAVLEVVVKYRW